MLLPGRISRPLDYLPPKDLAGEFEEGAYLHVPLRRGQEVGVVWGPGSGEIEASKLRPASAAIELPPMRAELREFLRRAAAYTLTPLGRMLSLSVRRDWLQQVRSATRMVRRSDTAAGRLTAARKRVLEALPEGAEIEATELARRSGCRRQIIAGMIGAGMLEEVLVARAVASPFATPLRVPKTSLTEAQASASKVLIEAVNKRRFATYLLQGVTGSGKTEVYLSAVGANFAQGRQTLVLLPEIALTSQFERRLEEYFGTTPALWHSRLGLAARRRIWQAVARGEAPIVAGARSALFLPFQDLGLVIVDEEHDASYKQAEGILYHARDMAVLRGQAAGVPVVLATATPSLETYANVRRGQYHRMILPARYGGAVLPDLIAVDLRRHRPATGSWIAPPLLRAMDEVIEAGRQALLFLNRRGYAPLMLCRGCGYRLGCPHCETWLVLHQSDNSLNCHQCGHHETLPDACPACVEKGLLAPCGPGVERIAEEVASRFPDARHAVLSSDTAKGGAALSDQLAAIGRGEVDIIIGTQIVAKGHDFPSIALVGVIDADLCLRGADLRAGERTFQVIRQVTGRAGRAGGVSRAFLQTSDPENPVIQAILAGDEEAFLQQLEAERKPAAAPPYGHWLGVIVSGEDAGDVRKAAQALAAEGEILSQAGIRLYGPAPAPFSRLRGKWRWRLLATAPREVRLQGAVVAWRRRVTAPRGVRIVLDIDPQNFL